MTKNVITITLFTITPTIKSKLGFLSVINGAIKCLHCNGYMFIVFYMFLWK